MIPKRVFWNDVKSGAIVRSPEKFGNEHYKVMDNKKGIRRMVEAHNGDMGDMYIYNFTEVLVENEEATLEEERFDWVPLAVTAAQARQLTTVAIFMEGQEIIRYIQKMEEVGKDE